MSFKIPCGGFRLDEKSFSLDENGVLSVSGVAYNLTGTRTMKQQRII